MNWLEFLLVLSISVTTKQLALSFIELFNCFRSHPPSKYCTFFIDHQCIFFILVPHVGYRVIFWVSLDFYDLSAIVHCVQCSIPQYRLTATAAEQLYNAHYWFCLYHEGPCLNL